MTLRADNPAYVYPVKLLMCNKYTCFIEADLNLNQPLASSMAHGEHPLLGEGLLRL